MSDDQEISKLGQLRPAHDLAAELLRRQVRGRVFGAPSELRVGRYALRELLGVGGMGEVFLGHDESLGRDVALKFLHPERVGERARVRLHREAKTLAQLNHVNVVTVHEIGEHAGDTFVAMEYVDGGTLLDWAREHHDRRALLELCIQAARGLIAAHERGVIHRDFKPSNVLVGLDGMVRVADFGLASAPSENGSTGSGESPTSTNPGLTQAWAGTPGYVAPELYASAAPDPLSDQFSYCACVWELHSGQRPYDVQTLQAAYERGKLPRPRSFGGPRWLERALERGLAFEPQQRWPSMSALVAAVEAGPRRRRRGGVAALALGALAALFTAWPEGPPRACTAPSPWPWLSTQRSALEDFARGDDPLASAVPLVLAEFGQFESEWARSRAQLCSAHYSEGTLSAASFDRRMSCLREAERQAEALGAALTTAPSKGLGRASTFLDELPDPRACVSVSAPPAQLDVGSTVLWADALNEGRASLAIGDFARAQELADGLEDHPSAPPLVRAQALLIGGEAARERGQLSDAQARLVEGEQLALSTQLFNLAIDFELLGARIEVAEYEDPRAARAWLQRGRNTLDTLGTSDARAGQLELIELELAAVELDTNADALDELELERRWATLHARLRQVIAQLERSGADERNLDNARLQLANALAIAGQLEDALELYERLFARQSQRLGASHPSVGLLAYDIALSLYEAERWAEAHTYAALALKIFRTSQGPKTPDVASALTLVADLKGMEGDPEEALALAREAWSIQREALPPESSEYGSALIVLGWVAAAVAEDYETAVEAHEEMLNDADIELAALGGRAAVHQTLAWLHLRLGNLDEADWFAHRVLLTGDEQTWRRARHVLAEVDYRRGEHARALEWVERLRAAPPLDPPDGELDAELLALAALAANAAGRPSMEVEALAREALAQSNRAHLASVLVEELRTTFPELE